MKLSKLVAGNYRSLREQSIGFSDLNLFIGANASGKSTILDALRFLHEGVRAREFQTPVFHKGGMPHLLWKGDVANRIQLVVHLKGEDRIYEWLVRLVKEGGYGFYIEEEVSSTSPQEPTVKLLYSSRGTGWWRSGENGQQVDLKHSGTACALSAAAADASFPARDVAEFVGRWGFFDPSPFLHRRDWASVESGRFDPYGRNLGEILHTLRESSPRTFEEIVAATRAVVGLPTEIETRESESDGRFYFLQNEPGLRYRVHQMGVSSGTLRIVQHQKEGGTVVLPQDDPDGVRKALEASGFGLGQHYETKGFGAD